ncbi:hypothetical protein GOOTI_194_00010 [Gordonia otitidis NBRC 100426]|uniref:DNA primase/polymerase bifunctional N-terminal domain-containing protein n=2 Tax=Gordonia otitidis TaxID=249058 RepID=H5TRF8_GORO1|nr:hypothetical protein GOOTI_194_00010 [Gordonia otitidis NBRC 100426]
MPQPATAPVHGTRINPDTHHCFRIAAAWAPRRRVRVDTANTHQYKTVRRFPRNVHDSIAPTQPWAVELFDTLGQLRIIGIDFDDKLGHHARPDTDADDLFTCLQHLGLPALLSSSSPHTRRRHIWILCADNGLTAPQTTTLRRLLAARYPSIDPTPLTNPDSGALRFPGAPHRAGGHAELIAVSTPPNCDPTAVLTGASRAATDIVDRLAAHFAATGTPPHLTNTPQPRQAAGVPRGWVVRDRDTLSAAITAATTELRCSRYRLAAHVTDAGLPPLELTATDVADQLPQLHTTPTAADAAVCLTSLPDATQPPPQPLDLTSTTIAPTAVHRVDDCVADRDSHTSIDDVWPADYATRAESLGLRDHLNALPARILALLNPAATVTDMRADASRIERSVLLACAHAGWDSDTVTLLQDAFAPAAFTHSQSQRLPATIHRQPRTPHAARTHLLRQFDRARAAVTRYTPRPDTDRDRTIDDITDRATRILAWADQQHITYRCDTHLLRRILEAHLVCALTGTSTYYASTRELARIAAVNSPQTAATYTRILVDLNVIDLRTPAAGRRAHEFELRTPDEPSWTQGVPAPHAPTRELATTAPSMKTLRESLQKKLGLFAHDVWTAPGGTHASLLLAALHTIPGCDTAAAACTTGLTADQVTRATRFLTDAGLLTTPDASPISDTQWQHAAQKTRTAGAWHRRRTRWTIQRACWDWWQAEHEFLAAPHDHKHTVWASTVLSTLGRYPRTTSPQPGGSTADHAAAYRRLAPRYTPTRWVTQ